MHQRFSRCQRATWNDPVLVQAMLTTYHECMEVVHMFTSRWMHRDTLRSSLWAGNLRERDRGRGVCVCGCGCVCVSEREREREREHKLKSAHCTLTFVYYTSCTHSSKVNKHMIFKIVYTYLWLLKFKHKYKTYT